MEKYLVVITTVLVLTQWIRLMQNKQQLKYMKAKKEEESKISESWDQLTDTMNRLIKSNDEVVASNEDLAQQIWRLTEK